MTDGTRMYVGSPDNVDVDKERLELVPSLLPPPSGDFLLSMPRGGLEAASPEDFHPRANVLTDSQVDVLTEAARECVARANAREAAMR